MGVTGGVDMITDGLVFYVDAANPNSYISGNTTTNDLILDNNGTLTNGVGFSTENNGAWDFDGTNDYVGCNTLVDTVKDDNIGTISIWVKPNDILNNRVFISFTASNQTRQYLTMALSGTYNFYVAMRSDSNPSSGFFVYSDTNPFVPGQWINLNVTQDGVSPQLYVNGVSVSQTFFVDDNDQKWINDMSSFNLVNISRLVTSNLNQNYFDGQIANVNVYNKDLSSDEVLQNYNALKGRFGL